MRGAAALVAIAAALCGIEAWLRLFLPQPLGLSYRAANGLTLHIPGASLRYRRTEFDNRIDINSLGLRDREVSLAKSPGVFRILVLGDSFAEGKQVALDETFSKLLERRLRERFAHRRWEVIDGGVSGYGTADEIKFFDVLGRRLEPDLVILAFCVGNDVQNNAASPYFQWRASQLKELPLQPPGRAELALARLREFAAAHSHLYQFLRDRYHRTASPDADPLEDLPVVQTVAASHDDDWRLTEALIDLLRARVDAAGARFFLVAIPQRVQVYDDEWTRSTGRDPGDASRLEPQHRLSTFSRRRLAPFLDPLTEIHEASIDARTYFRIDGHLTARGHEVLADAILDSLVNFHLLGDTR
jgi:lysophospholipase L1-like esterase